jgi:hypothetical protein
MLKHMAAAAAIMLILAGLSFGADSTTVFKGRPSLKISEGGVSRAPEKIDNEKAANLQCIISKISDTYYWASRENTRLVPVETGAFITYIAANGAGYVRVINPKLRSMASLMSETEDTFDYVEHVLIGLRSITYYGRAE